MDKNIATLRAEIAERQASLRVLVDKERAQRTSKAGVGYNKFDSETLRQHRAERSPTLRYMLNLPLRVHLSGPFVYGMILPIAFLDISLVVFQATGFRLWGVSPVRRRDYVVVDRHHLAYLNGLEKLNCVYCGYANGVFAFAREIAARTEKIWCPIKHAIRIRQAHSNYDDFIEFGDVDAWKDHPARKKPKK